jgi:hypothetical protein
MELYSIKVAKGRTPKFPDLCVGCYEPAPSASVRLYTSAIGWWTAFFAFGALHRVDIPACKPCAGKLWRARALRFGVTVALIAVLVGVVSHFTEGMRWRRPIGIVATLIGLIPWIVWQMIFPAAVDITAYDDSIEYDFRDADYAAEFSVLNETNADPG